MKISINQGQTLPERIYKRCFPITLIYLEKILNRNITSVSIMCTRKLIEFPNDLEIKRFISTKKK